MVPKLKRESFVCGKKLPFFLHAGSAIGTIKVMGLPTNILSEIRMSDTCKRLRSLAKIFAMQINDPEFSNHILHMSPCGNNTGTWLKMGDNP